MARSRLLEELRQEIRTRQYSYRTEQAYVYWARHFVRFHRMRHPRELGKGEVAAFLSYLAIERKVAPSTQNQALSALVFLYRHVIRREVGWIDDVVRAKGRARVPVVLSPQEVHDILAHMRDPYHLMAQLNVRRWIAAARMHEPSRQGRRSALSTTDDSRRQGA